MGQSNARKLSFPSRQPKRFGVRISDTVVDLKPYEPVSSLPRMIERPGMNHYKLDWNECTVAPSPRVKRAVLKCLDGSIGMNYYPELFSGELRLRLQSHVGYPKDHLLVTNGSDEALDLICKTYLDSGDGVLAPYPTYTHMLLFARSRGAVIDQLLFDDPFVPDIDKLISHIDENTKIVYLVNPNNPMGYMLDREDIAEVAQAAPNALIVIDEAYVEFAGGKSMMGLVGDYKNVVITRTFSKAYGLAGLRVGYMVAQPTITKEIGKIYNPKSVNQFAQVAASAVLDDLPYYKRYVDEVERSKELFGRWCERQGLTFRSSYGNFVMIKHERVKEIVTELAENGVYVRDRSSMDQLEGHFRLNLGTKDQTVAVIRIFDKVLHDLGILD